MSPSRAASRISIALLAAFLVSAIAVPLSARAQERRGLRGLWWDRATVAESAYYSIKTDLDVPEARAYARHLDIMYQEYQRRLASLRPRGPEKLQVYIFSRQREYLLTMRVRWGINAAGTGGMFFVNESGSGLAFWTEDLSPRRIHHIMQHEGFHQFAWSRFGTDLPMWANEGLAEFFGLSVLLGDRLVLGQSTPHVVETVQHAIETGTALPFDRFLGMSNGEWNRRVADGSAGVAYEQAWSMVHFLVYGDDGRYRDALERYLTLLNAGVRGDEAWSRVFGDDIAAFEERWRAYANAARPSSFITALDRIEFLAAGAQELAKRNVIPASLEELQEALTTIGFEYTFDHEGRHVVLRADEPRNYVIPMDDLARRQPLFVVTSPRGATTLREERHRQAHPQPPDIEAHDLVPRGLSVRWDRDRETGKVSFQVVVD